MDSGAILGIASVCLTVIGGLYALHRNSKSEALRNEQAHAAIVKQVTDQAQVVANLDVRMIERIAERDKELWERIEASAEKTLAGFRGLLALHEEREHAYVEEALARVTNSAEKETNECFLKVQGQLAVHDRRLGDVEVRIGHIENKVDEIAAGMPEPKKSRKKKA